MSEKVDGTDPRDDDIGEEETKVLLDFDELSDLTLFQQGKEFYLENLETPQPLLYVDEYIFEGTYAEPLGTNLIFSTPVSELNQSQLESIPTKQIKFKLLSHIPSVVH